MASTYLSRTFGTATNSKKYTFSAWIKRANISNTQSLISYDSGGTALEYLRIDSDGVINFAHRTSGGTIYRAETTSVFRDVSAWYHIVFIYDTTDATAGDRLKIYVNNVRQPIDSGTQNDPSLNLDTFFTGNTVDLARWQAGSEYFDGEMAHVHFIDGTAYSPSDFGETDSTTEIWKPKTAPSVTYGTNGFFLKFENSGSMGTDSSGNGNNFTVNGTMTQTIDTPSNVFATLIPYLGPRFSTQTYSNGNTSVSGGSGFEFHPSSLGMTTGKYYFEAKLTNKTSYPGVGIIASHQFETNNQDAQSNSQGYVWHHNGQFNNNGTVVYTGNAINANDICMIAFDATNGVLWFGKNGTWENSATQAEIEAGTTTNAIWSNVTNAGTDSYHFLVQNYDSAWSTNFGNGYFGTTAVSSAQNPDDGIGIFEYSVPTGYKALCTKSINAQEYD